MTADPFDTARLRRAVLDAWTAHPPRFREDANAEEDNAHRYYRDRVVVELAQNAADAAARAGVPGRLSLRLAREGATVTLTALNTGAPLSADGVASLASLRASAKRDPGAVGRFGVGFAAVRAVADEVTVASRTGTVHFSLGATRAGLAAAPALADEAARRGDALPALRLPFAGPAPGHPDAPPAGWDTAVVLTLRDDVAVDRLRADLAAVDDVLLLALPALTEVEVAVEGRTRTLRDVGERWVVASRTGRLDPDLLADAPVEDRERVAWRVTWAVPREPASAAPRTGVVHAPTPTDEPCTLPGLLVATLPLDPSRRHVAPGPVTDAVVAAAGQVWADLLLACRASPPPAPDPADLLPAALPAGALDAALHAAVVAATRAVPVLPAADGGRVAATDAVALPPATDRALLGALAPWLAGLVDLAPHQRHLVRLLGVRTTDLGEVVDALPAADPAVLRRVLDAVRPDAPTLEGLATLPVLLADGRAVRGARGLVLVDGVPDAALRVLAGWGVRAVHPEAAHPLLERLGAERVDAWGLLRHPAVRERVLGADPDEPADAGDLLAAASGGTPADDAAAVAEVVLALVRAGLAAGPAPDVTWWGELLLEAADGDRVPAAGLVLPGSDAARWFAPAVLPPVADHLVRRWPDELGVVGVRSGLRVLTVAAEDGGAEAGDGAGLDGLDAWHAYLDDLTRRAGGAALAEHLVVADLDAVRDAAWPEVLAALSRGPARRALVEGPPGAPAAPSYAAWWLRRRSALELGRPFLLPGRPGDGHGLLGGVPRALAGLADDVPVLRALGGVASLGELDAEGWSDALDHLPALGADVDPALAVAVWRALARLAAADEDLDPDRVPALVDGRCVVAPVDDVAVADPMWAQHPSVAPVLVVPSAACDDVAAWLDVDLAAERAPGRVTSTGTRAAVPPVVTALEPDAPTAWVEHADLRVDGEPVSWWVADGEPHAADLHGLARALAHDGRWSVRADLERVLLDPARRADVLLERAGDAERPA